MDKGKVTFVINRHQVMVIFIDLYRCQLPLVDNVLITQGAKIEPIVQTNDMSCSLPQHIELSLKMRLVIEPSKIFLRSLAITICRLENNKWLQDYRFPGQSRRT